MIEVHPYVSVFLVFHCEPMHMGSSEISPSLRKYVSLTLKGDMQMASNKKTNKGITQNFKAVKTPVWKTTDYFLGEAKQMPFRCEVHVYFNQHDCPDKMKGNFTEAGIIETVEAKEHDAVYGVVSFTGALND